MKVKKVLASRKVKKYVPTKEVLKMKKAKVNKAPSKLRLVNFKATEREFKAIKANAELVAGGNMSLYIRLMTAGSKKVKTKKVA